MQTEKTGKPMKRMDEVFDLPVIAPKSRRVELRGLNGDSIAMFKLEIDTKHAAHAINHVEALADSLEVCIAFIDKQCCLDIDASDNVKIDAAINALKAYRGEK